MEFGKQSYVRHAHVHDFSFENYIITINLSVIPHNWFCQTDQVQYITKQGLN